MRRIVTALLAVALAGCGPRAATEAAAPPPPAAPVSDTPDRGGAHAGVPDLTLPDTEQHRAVRRGLEARLSFHRAGDERPALLQRLAIDHLEEAEEADRAAMRVEAWLAEVGPYPEAEALRARLAEQARTNRAAAIRTLERVVAEHPQDENAGAALYTLATALGQEGRREEALALEQRLIAEHPESEFVPDALLDLGDAAFDAGDMAAARRHYESIRARPPATVTPFATYKLAWVHWNRSALDEAQALLREVATLPLASEEDPLHALRRAARRDYAVLYANVGGVEAAPEHFRALFGDEAGPLLGLLARAYLDAGRIDAAGALAHRLLEGTAPCDPAALDWLSLRMRVALHEGRPDGFLDEADAWVARLGTVRECRPAVGAGERRRDGVTFLRDVLARWRAERAATHPGRDAVVERLEGIVEGLDPEDPPPSVR